MIKMKIIKFMLIQLLKLKLKDLCQILMKIMKLKLDNEKNSRINSLKMEMILKNQSKIYKKESKNEEFIEFYINDNNKNVIYNLKATIYTTKYNLFSFIPKWLFIPVFKFVKCIFFIYCVKTKYSHN